MSIVRANLMTRPGYTPYCGNDVSCAYRNPRTFFKRGQFNCLCGWQSSFEPEFITQYQAKWATESAQPQSRTEPAPSNPSPLNQESDRG